VPIGRRLFGVCCLCVLLAASSRGLTGQGQDARTLDLGVAVERALAAGESHKYDLDLTAGEFITIVIRQHGVDVAASLVAPDGRELVSVDASDDDVRPERIVDIAESDGRYAVVVRPADPDRRGRYTIALEERRVAGLPDDTRVAAERALEQGERLRDPSRAAGWPEAQAQFTRAAEKFRDIGDRNGEMRALLGVAMTQYLRSLPEALETARQVEQLARTLDDQITTSRVLKVIANIFVWRGELAAAIPLFDESIAISQRTGTRAAEARALNDQALIYNRMGDSEKALAQYERALPAAIAAGDRALEAALLNNMGIASKNLGDYERARHAYERALANRKAAGDRRGQWRALINLGNTQRILDNPRNALAFHTDALALATQVGAKEDEALTFGAMGLDYAALGEYDEALDSHRQALTLRKDLGDVAGQASSLEGIGHALQQLGRLQEARDALREALATHRRIDQQFGVRDTLGELSIVERGLGNTDEALADIKGAVDLDEALRARITSPELRTSFVAAEQDKYELLIDLLQQIRVRPDAMENAPAFEVAERARARVLLESLIEARVDLRQGIEPALLTRERALQKQLNDASTQLSRTLAGGGRADEAAAAQKVTTLASDYQALQAQIRRQSPRYAAVTQPQPLSASEIQRDVLDEGTVLLEFALGAQRSWLWAVTPSTLDSIELPPRQEIETAARALYGHLTARQRRRGETAGAYAQRVADADRRAGRESIAISRMLFGGIADRLNGEWRDKRLAIVAAGALEYLPFAALPAPSPAGQHARGTPMAAHHEIVTIPSGSVLGVLRRQNADRPAASRTAAIVADPVFESTDPRVTAASARQASLSRDAGERESFVRLPFSRDEASAIAALVPARDVMEETGFQASRASVLNGALADFRIVHFATHGVLDNQRPSLSGLVLSLVTKGGERQNGYVRLHDIYNLRLGADLVVLSACQTALGKEMKGEGLIGLTRAFMYAGAPRVVATLWQVNDLATAELMKHFYGAMLQGGLRPAAALREAQLRLSKDARWAPPYYWAGFVLQGDWK
jgi:CHAT domain-containing protein/Tfp pilus assembly protein PilF